MAGPATSFLCGTLVVLGVMLVLSFGIETKTKITVTSNDHRSWTSAKLQQQEEQVKVLWKGKSSMVHEHPKQDLDYMSKRRVPNGPDPIHNRRAGNSGRPPGQA